MIFSFRNHVGIDLKKKKKRQTDIHVRFMLSPLIGNSLQDVSIEFNGGRGPHVDPLIKLNKIKMSPNLQFSYFAESDTKDDLHYLEDLKRDVAIWKLN